MSGPINYPPEIVEAVNTMNTSAQSLDGHMQDLGVLVRGLTSGSRGAALDAYGEVERLWQQSGYSHNTALADMAKTVNSSYDEMMAYDLQMSHQMRGR